MQTPLRVAVVDDEPLAVRRLRSALQRLPGIEVVGAATSASTAQRLLATETVDVLLLDIQMPGLSGLDLLRACPPASAPAVIFVTAHADFAAEAFELAAVDYLLKPVQPFRLRVALDRARRAVAAMSAEQRIAELQAALAQRGEPAPAALSTEAPGYETELWVRERGDRIRLEVDLIDWIEAEREYIRVHSRGRSFLLRRSIRDVQAKLDPEDFIRVHRGALVRKDRIVRVTGQAGGPITLVLRTGAEVPVARRSLAAVKRSIQRIRL
jgi:two-component system LytT family response regulator/two-component system response regulator AlgR